MKYTHEIDGVQGGSFAPGACPWSMLREQNPSCVSAFLGASSHQNTYGGLIHDQ